MLLDGFLCNGPPAITTTPALTLGVRDFLYLDWPTRDSQQGFLRSSEPIVSNLPVSTAPRVVTGSVTRSFYDDYYERIHFNPNPVDLGNVVSGLEQIVDVWNAYSISRSMTAFTPPADTGITVTEPGALPMTMTPYSLYEYTLSVSKEGPPEIDDLLQWTISGIDYDVPVLGRRVLLWPLKPSWDGAVQETLEWKTAVERSYSGKEQRAALRKDPRRVFEYTVKITKEDAQFLDSVMYGWGGRPYGQPIWPERSKLTAGAAVGATTINLDTTNRSFIAGGFLALFRDRENNESCEIVTVNASSIVVKKPLLASWGLGTHVYPLMVAKFDGVANVRRLTDSVVEAPVRFLGMPQETNPRIPVVAAPVTYGGLELYLERTNWGEPVTFTYDADYEQIDSDVGTFSMVERSPFPSVGKSHTWMLKGAAEITTFRGWLGRRAGQAKPVWMPTDTSDFTLLETITDNATQITVEANGYERYAVGKPGREHVMFQLKNGTYHIRKITAGAAGVTPGTAILTLETALGVEVTPADIRRICFLGLWRLASDNVTLVYQTDGVATVSATMRLVRPT